MNLKSEILSALVMVLGTLLNGSIGNLILKCDNLFIIFVLWFSMSLIFTTTLDIMNKIKINK